MELEGNSNRGRCGLHESTERERHSGPMMVIRDNALTHRCESAWRSRA